MLDFYVSRFSAFVSVMFSNATSALHPAGYGPVRLVTQQTRRIVSEMEYLIMCSF